jgi:thiamine biosynthesis lipoprotein
VSPRGEAIEAFECFAAPCAVLVIGDGATRSAADAASEARDSLLEWHRRFSRFLDDSELSMLNRDPRREVPASAVMCRLAQAILDAGAGSGGLVDATMVDQLESAGYGGNLPAAPTLEHTLKTAPARRPAGPGAAGWQRIEVDHERGAIRRPPGLKLDSGGLAKGLFADVLAERLATHPGFAINCAGDLAIGGTAAIDRPVKVASPFDGSTLHTFALQAYGVATSGIGRRSWLDRDGRPAHHLLDPASGRPAFTGVVQVTALAPSALSAEIRAKSALLSGPRRAPLWLPDGGVIVLDDGSHRVLEPPPSVTLSRLSAFAEPGLRAS